jgi:hypothetical protein
MKFSIPAVEPRTTASPFNRPRERSYARFSTSPRALNFNDPEKPLDDYFWMPMAQNNSLFNAFIIEFENSAQPISAVVWILQMTLSEHHGGSSEGNQLIKLIKTKAKEVMRQKVGRRRKVGEVTVKYVLVSPQGGEWKLPEENWQEGDVYYQCVKLSWYVVACHVCPDN